MGSEWAVREQPDRPPYTSADCHAPMSKGGKQAGERSVE